jgi:hypothetical protein
MGEETKARLDQSLPGEIALNTLVRTLSGVDNRSGFWLMQ